MKRRLGLLPGAHGEGRRNPLKEACLRVSVPARLTHRPCRATGLGC